jgi:S-DNA-T family DNA segregation ATPase FtsK/SpoIIIE
VLHVLRQGKYGRRVVKFSYRSATAPVAGATLMARTAWRWIRADDYAGTDDHVFRESVRTRRRRTAWMLGLSSLAATSAGTWLWSTSAPYMALAAVAAAGTAVEVRKRVKDRPVPFKLPGRRGGTPQENQVVRAAIDAKLGRAEGMRLASPVLTEEGGWSTVLQLPPGQRARACLGKEADFASALGVGESQVVFELVDEHAGRLTVYVAKSDPFLKLYPSPLLGRTEPMDFWAGIPAGVNGRGHAERLRLVDASLLVAGEPRAGKSAAVNGIIGTAALAVTPKIHLWDGKGAGDHRPWRRIAHTAEKRNAKGLLAHLLRMQAQMEKVFDLLDEAGGSTKLNPELCRQFGVDVELTIVDETRYYVSSPWGG